jgi:adenosylmethionine-8-amino-7-oxononanoate aminotransferase
LQENGHKKKRGGHQQKYKFLSGYYGYHGRTFGAMAASGAGVRKTKFEPQMAGFLKVFPPNYYRDRFDTWEACNRLCGLIPPGLRSHRP